MRKVGSASRVSHDYYNDFFYIMPIIMIVEKCSSYFPIGNLNVRPRISIAT